MGRGAIDADLRSPEYLDLEAGRRRCDRRGHVAHRERPADAMGVTFQYDPACDLAVVPHGLVTDGAGLARVDDEGDEPRRGPASLSRSTASRPTKSGFATSTKRSRSASAGV